MQANRQVNMEGTMFVQLRIPPKLKKKLQAGAKAEGLSLNAYVLKLLGALKP